MRLRRRRRRGAGTSGARAGGPCRRRDLPARPSHHPDHGRCRASSTAARRRAPLTISVCAGRHRPHGPCTRAQPSSIKVCWFAPRTPSSTCSSTPPTGGSPHVGDLPADGNGAVAGGPFRLTDPGTTGSRSQGTARQRARAWASGVRRRRGMSRPMAEPESRRQRGHHGPGRRATSRRPGGDGSGHSTALWGAGLLLLGGLLVLLYVRRRRRRTPAEARRQPSRSSARLAAELPTGRPSVLTAGPLPLLSSCSWLRVLGALFLRSRASRNLRRRTSSSCLGRVGCSGCVAHSPG